MWSSLSANPNLFWTDVLEHPEIPWSFPMMSANPNITLETILRNPDRGWSRNLYCCNPNFRYEHMALWDATIKNDPTSWNIFAISEHPSVTMETVMANPEFPWFSVGLLSNPSIGEAIRSYPPYGRFLQNKVAQPSKLYIGGNKTHPFSPYMWEIPYLNKVTNLLDLTYTWDTLRANLRANNHTVYNVNHLDYHDFSDTYMFAYAQRRATARLAVFKEELLQAV